MITKVAAQKYRTGSNRHTVGEKVLQRVAIYGGYPHWGCPFMVGLMDVLVELWVMKQPVKGGGERERERGTERGKIEKDIQNKNSLQKAK